MEVDSEMSLNHLTAYGKVIGFIKFGTQSHAYSHFWASFFVESLAKRKKGFNHLTLGHCVCFLGNILAGRQAGHIINFAVRNVNCIGILDHSQAKGVTWP